MGEPVGEQAGSGRRERKQVEFYSDVRKSKADEIVVKKVRACRLYCPQLTTPTPIAGQCPSTAPFFASVTCLHSNV